MSNYRRVSASNQAGQFLSLWKGAHCAPFILYRSSGADSYATTQSHFRRGVRNWCVVFW